jgi:hypothetical protein
MWWFLGVLSYETKQLLGDHRETRFLLGGLQYTRHTSRFHYNMRLLLANYTIYEDTSGNRRSRKRLQKVLGYQISQKPYRFLDADITNTLLRYISSWLKHYVTSRKVAGSIPDKVNGFFILHNPFGHTMVLGVSGSCRGIRLTNSPSSVRRLSRNAGSTTSHNPVVHQVLLKGMLYLLS